MKQLFMDIHIFLVLHLPDSLQMQNQKYVDVLPQPESGETLQELGQHGRVVSGSGVFVGEEAEQEWEALCACYAGGGSGTLYLPGRKPVQAIFAELSLQQPLRRTYIVYRFLFQELLPQAKQPGVYTAKTGDCLWSAATAAGTTPEELLQANPGHIRWANELTAGQKLVVP